jgi:hypothetical protein
LDGENTMENIVLADEAPLWAWMLLMYQMSLQEKDNVPYMYGSNNMYTLGKYKNILNTKEVKK